MEITSPFRSILRGFVNFKIILLSFFQLITGMNIRATTKYLRIFFIEKLFVIKLVNYILARRCPLNTENKH